METLTLLRRTCILMFLIVFHLTGSAQKFEAPSGEEWLIHGFEDGWSSPYHGWETGSIERQIVDNPIKDESNSSNKCVFIQKKEEWIDFAIHTNNGYFDFSEWEKFSMDILVTNSEIYSYKIQLCSGGGWDVIAEKESGISVLPNQWTTIEWDITDLIKEGRITATTEVTAIRFSPNSWGGLCEGYIDNYRLTRGGEELSLTNDGTATSPVLKGDWDESTFNDFNFNYSILTTIDFTEVNGLTELPTMESLNPNCFIYVNTQVSDIEERSNVVVFENGTGTAKTIELQEGNYFHNTREFTALSTTYTRDFSLMNGWASICLPFAPDNYADFELRTLKQVTTTGEETTLTFGLPEGNMEANTPYIIKANADTPKVFMSENSVIPVTNLNSVNVEEYIFTGNYTYKGADEVVGNYFLKTDGSAFGVATADSYIAAFRAYIYTNNPSPKNLTVKHDDGETTLITPSVISEKLIISANKGTLSITASEKMQINIYALDGRIVKNITLQEGENNVNDLPNGVYILNNQKVIVK